MTHKWPESDNIKFDWDLLNWNYYFVLVLFYFSLYHTGVSTSERLRCFVTLLFVISHQSDHTYIQVVLWLIPDVWGPGFLTIFICKFIWFIASFFRQRTIQTTKHPLFLQANPTPPPSTLKSRSTKLDYPIVKRRWLKFKLEKQTVKK